MPTRGVAVTKVPYYERPSASTVQAPLLRYGAGDLGILQSARGDWLYWNDPNLCSLWGSSRVEELQFCRDTVLACGLGEGPKP